MDISTRQALTVAANTVVEENADTLIETIREGLEPIAVSLAATCNVKTVPEVVVTLNTTVTDEGTVAIQYAPRLVFVPTHDMFEQAQNQVMNMMWVEMLKRLS